MDTQVLGPKFETWLEKQGVPMPKLGGSFAYCPHQEMTQVKVPRRKTPKTIYIPCKFKTRQLRRYARHYRRRHASTIAVET